MKLINKIGVVLFVLITTANILHPEIGAVQMSFPNLGFWLMQLGILLFVI